MKEIKLRAAAKINLSLDIVGRREDGYHLMDMVMQSVGLADTVRLKKQPEQVSVSVMRDGLQVGGIPQDDTNTAVRAARLFFQHTGLHEGCQIQIEKRIPHQAGMGGGSADAAAVLIGLNRLYGAGLSPQQLAEIGLQVGADVPFCLVGGTARVGGIGERIEPVTPLTVGHLVVIKPPFGISTGEAFASFDRHGVSLRPDNEALIRAIGKGDLSAMAMAMVNGMEESAGHPEIRTLREELTDAGARATLMTGSGSAVYGIFASELEALSAMGRMLGAGKTYLTVPVPEGVQIAETL